MLKTVRLVVVVAAERWRGAGEAEGEEEREARRRVLATIVEEETLHASKIS